MLKRFFGAFAKSAPTIDGKCVSSAGKDGGEWQKIYAAFLNATAVTVYSRSLSLVSKVPGDKKKFDFEVDALQVNDTIRAGEDRYLFRLAPGTLKLFRGADTSAQVEAADKFSQNAYTVPIIIHACSATGRTCMFVGEAAACTSMPATGRGVTSQVAPPTFAPG